MTRKITTRTIRRLRAPPRIVSLSGDIGFATPLEEETKEDEFFDKLPDEVVPALPRVISSVTMRPERETELPVTAYTSVTESGKASRIPRISVPRRETHRRVTTIDVERINSKGRKTYETQDEPPTIDRDQDILAEMTDDLHGTGLKLLPGQHIFVDLGAPSMDANTSLIVNGDQAVRVAFATLSGHLVSSTEASEHHLPCNIPIPVGSRVVHFFGFGNSNDSSNHLPLGPNSISLNCSTDNTTAVGFQAHTRIVGVPNTLFVCRGGVLRFDHLSIDTKNSLRSRELLKAAKVVTLETSTSANTLMAIVNSKSLDTIQVLNNGTAIEMEPMQVNNGALSALIWEISDSENQIQHFTISSQEVGSIHSLMVMRGSPESWNETMQNRHWDTIVEEGALSNHGSATISFDSPNPLQKEEEEKK